MDRELIESSHFNDVFVFRRDRFYFDIRMDQFKVFNVAYLQHSSLLSHTRLLRRSSLFSTFEGFHSQSSIFVSQADKFRKFHFSLRRFLHLRTIQCFQISRRPREVFVKDF